MEPADDLRYMDQAIDLASSSRLLAPPNPWVGAVVVTADGRTYAGSTQPPGGPHAEVVALEAAGGATRGSTVYVTLEPCAHQGRTGPCAQALVRAEVARVVLGVEDPDPLVAGRGIRALREAGVAVTVGVRGEEVAEQLRAYLAHRRRGRPWAVLKLAATLDGRIAAPDGSSRWITGPEARADAHRLRAESGAVVVGAGTVRADDPALTVRDLEPGAPVPPGGVDPIRVVLGEVPEGARAVPARSFQGDPGALLAELGSEGIVQVLVEGGAEVAGQFHRAGLVDEYVLYLAPALMGGERGRPMFAGPGAATIAEVWRGRVASVDRLGEDLRVVVRPRDR